MEKDSGFWSRWLLALIILSSFYHFSFYFSPLLNSDSALGVLMGQYLQLPQDLYCWGQDRGGNFIPILARFFHISFGAPFLITISLIHYMILITGYFGFAHFLRSHFLKIVLALFWFLPPWQFVEFLLYPYGIQYSILGIVIYLLFGSPNYTAPIKKIALEISVGIIATIGLWISDFLVISIVSLFLTAMLYQRQSILTTRRIILITFWVIISGCFIIYAKLQSVPSHHYSAFNLSSGTDFHLSLTMTWQSIRRILLFNSESDLQSLFWWVAIITGLLYLKIKKKEIFTIQDESTPNKFLVRFFLLNTIATFFALFSSKWVLANEMGRRYFTTLFISAALLILFKLDKKTITSTIMRGSFLTLGILSMLSAVENFYYPKFKKSKTSYIREVSTLAPAGIIGDYWNSYVYSSSNPGQLISSPHDKSTYRNIALIEKLFAQPNLYLAKDMWLKTFPDTLRQFGRILIKAGQEFHLGDSDFCKYRLDTNYYHFSYRPAIPTSMLLQEKIKGEKVIDMTNFQFNGFCRFDSLSRLKQVVELTGFNDATHSRYVRTEMDLGQGRYKILLNLRMTQEVDTKNDFLSFEISKKDGKTIHVPIPISSLQADAYTFIPVEINVENPKERLRFELNAGKSAVFFDRMVVKQQ